MITFLYKQREDGTYVIEHQGNPYHVIEEDEPLWSQCVEEYASLDEEPPDELEPKSPDIPLAKGPTLEERVAALEAKR